MMENYHSCVDWLCEDTVPSGDMDYAEREGWYSCPRPRHFRRDRPKEEGLRKVPQRLTTCVAP